MLGTRNEKFNLKGTIHTERGRWKDHRALVIERGTENYVTNPMMYCSTGTGLGKLPDDWSYVDGFGSGGDATYINDDHPDPNKGWWERMYYNGQAGDSGDYCFIYHDSADTVFTSGDDATFSLSVKGWSQNCNILIIIIARDDTSSLGTATNYIHSELERDTLKRFSVTYENLPSPVTGNLYLRVGIRIAGVDGAGDNGDITFCEAQLEKAAFGTSFAHGSMGRGYTWGSGGEHNAASYRSATEVELDDWVVGTVGTYDNMSVRCVFQVPFDYDSDQWSVSYPRIWECADSTRTQKMAGHYNTVTSQFYLEVNDGTNYTISPSTTQTFSAGDFLDVIFTWNWSAHNFKIYLNGVKIMDETESGADRPASMTQWSIGGATNNAGAVGFAFSEYAVFQGVLTDEEAAQLYARVRPISDAGALLPGTLTILDGRFRVASSTSGERVDILSYGIGVYVPSDADSTAVTGIDRILIGKVVDADGSVTDQILDPLGSDLGIFLYDDTDTLQVGMWAAGTTAGKLTAGGGEVWLDADGLSFDQGTATANKIKWYSSSTIILEQYASIAAGDIDAIIQTGACSTSSDYARVTIVGKGHTSNTYDAMLNVTGGQNYQQVDVTWGAGGMTVTFTPSKNTLGVDTEIDGGDLRVGHAIYVGTLVRDPQANTVTLKTREDSNTTRDLINYDEVEIYAYEDTLQNEVYIVFKVDDGGTNRYLYAELTGTGATWTKATTGPS